MASKLARIAVPAPALLAPTRLTSVLVLALALTSQPVWAHAKAAQQSEPEEPTALLDYQDTFNLEYATHPFFSPDGKHLYYQRRSADIMHDRTHTSLWQYNLDTKATLPVMAADESIASPVLSPDGSRLAYIAKGQLYVRYLASGDTAKLTNLTETPQNVVWSNDGQTLAFTLFTPAKAPSLFTDMPSKPEGAKWAKTAKYIEQTTYRFDGAGYLPSGFDQVYLLPATGGTPRQLTQGNYLYEGPLSFSPDDQSLYITALLEENFDLKPLEKNIYRLAIDTGELTAVTESPGPENDPQLSPNGKWLAFLHTNDRKLAYQNDVLKLLNLETGKERTLTTDLDRTIGDLQWQDNNNGLVISYLDHGQVKLAQVSTQGKFSPLVAQLGGTTLGRPYTSGNFALSSAGDIAYTASTPTQPADLALLRASNGLKGKGELVTQLNADALGHKTLAQVKKLSVTSSVDQRPIDAWIAYPPNYEPKQKYPLVLEIHGGPHAAYGPHFSMEIQLMAAKGYAVVWSNPRGSSSYGEDFGNLIHHNYPSADYDDLMDVVDAAVAQGSVDSDNLFITGGSGGGVLTAWSIGKTDRFKAAVVAKPVINWMSFALTADAYPFFTQYWMPGMPWDNADHLWQHSPLSLVGNVKTPTLLLTGEDDYRTPISESEQFYQALRLQGVDAAMVRIPGASHGIASRPSRLIQKIGNVIAWFDRYKSADEEERKAKVDKAVEGKAEESQPHQHENKQ